MAGFPSDEGQRVDWADVPEAVRWAIEDEIGSPVVTAATHRRGFSPGLAATITTAEGDRHFVKAANVAEQRFAAMAHGHEAWLVPRLPEDLPVPALRWTVEVDGWLALGFDVVDGHNPVLPWRSDDLRRVLDAVTDLARRLTPAPVEVRSAADYLTPMFAGWTRVADSGRVDRLPEPLRNLVPALHETATTPGPAAIAGPTLIHDDLRADNVLLAADRVWFVDWAHASTAAAWVDLALLLPSVEMQGGGRCADLWRAHPLSAGVDDAALDSLLAAFAGMLVAGSLRDPIPGLPTLQAFQRGQATPCLRWLGERRGWDLAAG